MLYMGKELSGINGACSNLCRISVTPSATYNQTGPFWCCFPIGWACAHTRPRCVSPMNSPVRLGISPAVASSPTGVFNQWFEALFPRAVALCLCGLFSSPAVPPGLCMCECGAPLPALLHNPPPCWVHQRPRWCEFSPPRLPVSAPPTGLDECFLFLSLFVGPTCSSIFCQFWGFFCF